MANWTPDGFVGETFRTTARYLPPPPGLKPAMRWGTEAGLRELFGDDVASLEITRRSAMFRFRSAQHWIEYFRTYYGPTLKAFAALDAAKQASLAQDFIALVGRYNRSGDETMIVPGDYLEIAAIKR
ncbi:MAG: SAM-dependent methyltransferase, partial [Chloroflexi bacterium]|nr:SAM-dependent methyltransferase [Chloroflexota bacterium]